MEDGFTDNMNWLFRVVLFLDIPTVGENSAVAQGSEGSGHRALSPTTLCR